MPKIPALPPMTSPDGADELPIEDVSVGTTKYITLTKLKEWLQALTAWITPTMWTNPYKCSVYLASTQTLGISTWTRVLLSTKEFDTSNNFDTTTRRFTAPVTGYYQISGQVAITSSGISNGTMTSAVYKNGTAFISATNLAASGDGRSMLRGNASRLCYLVAGDYLELFAYQSDSTSARDIAAGTNLTFFTAHLVSLT